MVTPRPHQRYAVDRMKNGSVLVGGTGSGKSLTSLLYFYEKVVGGSMSPLTAPIKCVDIFVITTAKKRDTLDWDYEAARFRISTDPLASIGGIKLTVDSWNNINKYLDITGAFFIFDEQKTSGFGVWSKTFIKITKNNQWVLLSATPADRWIDLMPVFVANGFYKNKSDFVFQHVVYSPRTNFPKIIAYRDLDKLKSIRNYLFVTMDVTKQTIRHISKIKVSYDEASLKNLIKTQWNPYKDKPVRNGAELFYLVRKLINSDESRLLSVIDIIKERPKVLIFYNFDYELNILKDGLAGLTTIAEYNGHKHEPLPVGDEWVYLLQYTSGNDAWECFTSDTVIFYSLNYSYRIVEQCMGRIDRLNTQYRDLYYFMLTSESALDNAIQEAYRKKRKFNEKNLKFQ